MTNKYKEFKIGKLYKFNPDIEYIDGVPKQIELVDDNYVWYGYDMLDRDEIIMCVDVHHPWLEMPARKLWIFLRSGEVHSDSYFIGIDEVQFDYYEEAHSKR